MGTSSGKCENEWPSEQRTPSSSFLREKNSLLYTHHLSTVLCTEQTRHCFLKKNIIALKYSAGEDGSLNNSTTNFSSKLRFFCLDDIKVSYSVATFEDC